jgi:MFS family permease
MLHMVLGKFSIDRNEFLLVFGLLFNVFTWYFFLSSFIDEVILRSGFENQLLVIWGAFYLSIVVFSIVGAFLSKRISIFKFFYSWILLGVIASLLPVLVNSFTVPQIMVISVFLGASFGIGMPSCLAFFAETTKVDNRGRVGGITFLVVFLVAALFTIPFGYLSLTMLAIICALWRGAGLSIYWLKLKKQDTPEVTKTSFFSILNNRSFLLYFIAWLMFCLVDTMEKSIVEQVLVNRFSELVTTELVTTMNRVEPIIATIFIFIAGFMCDWIGRKKIVLSGFVSLGVAYAILGFLGIESYFSWYMYFVVDGAAWGIFYLTFVLILWGDLSQPGSREKYYTLGSVPFFISYIIPHFVEFGTEELAAGFYFSVAAFFLFLAILPLIYAPETLPEKKIELRRLRSFAEDAKKAKEKYERKMGK